MEIEEVYLSYGHLDLGLGCMLSSDEQGIECGGDVVGAS
jgi:hypothetical protein